MEENDIIYIIPTALDKPIKIAFENKPIYSEIDYNKCLENLLLNIAAVQSNETLDQSCLSASVISKKLGNSR